MEIRLYKKHQAFWSLQDYYFKTFSSKTKTMEQELSFKSNDGKHIKFVKEVKKGHMKAEKYKRHSSELHFQRQVHFLTQGC